MKTTKDSLIDKMKAAKSNCETEYKNRINTDDFSNSKLFHITFETERFSLISRWQ